MKPANKQALVEEIKRAIGIGVDGVVPNYEVDLNYIDISAVTDMSYLFSDSKTYGFRLHKFNGNISEWDVSLVQNMGAMFSGATDFNQNISKWNVVAVTNMNSMFDSATKFNSDISEWKVGAVQNMAAMFWDAASFNQNLDAWGGRIHKEIERDKWGRAIAMFRGSGLTTLPSWCQQSCARGFTPK